MDGNPDHPGLSLATSELQSLLDNPQAYLSGRQAGNAAEHITRIATGGVEPRHVLAMVAAIALFEQDQPYFLRNEKAYRFGVARAVCSLTPRHRSMPLTVSCLGGYRLPDGRTLLPLVAAIVSAINTADNMTKERSAAMSAPLNSN